MGLSNKINISTSILVSSLMGTVMIMNEPCYGAEAQQLAEKQRRLAESARQSQRDVHQQQETYKQALDRAHDQLNPGTPLTRTLEDIVAGRNGYIAPVVGDAAHGQQTQTQAQRYTLLKRIEDAALGRRNDEAAKKGIRKALGISPVEPLGTTHDEVEHFINAVTHTGIEHATTQANITTFQAALNDPNATLRGAVMDPALVATGIVAGGGAPQIPLRIKALRMIEAAAAHDALHAQKAVVRRALGLDDNLNSALADQVTHNVSLFIHAASDARYLRSISDIAGTFNTSLNPILARAHADGNSAANPLPAPVDRPTRVAIIGAIFGGAHAVDHGFQQEILTALGLQDTLPMSHEVAALKDAFMLAARP